MQAFVRGRAAAGMLLLALTAHAFVASATHFHRLADPGPRPAQAALRSRGGDGPHAPLAGEDARCLLCRLQRNFVSNLQSAAVVVAAPSAVGLDYEALQKISPRTAFAPRSPGRAPPLA